MVLKLICVVNDLRPSFIIKTKAWIDQSDLAKLSNKSFSLPISTFGLLLIRNNFNLLFVLFYFLLRFNKTIFHWDIIYWKKTNIDHVIYIGK